MKKLLFLAVTCMILCVSCTESIIDDKKESVTTYAYSTDSSIVVFRHGTSTPIIFKKPITLEEIQKYGLSAKVIETIDKNKKGISRYIEEDENNEYIVSDGTALFGFIALILCIFLFAGLIVTMLD